MIDKAKRLVMNYMNEKYLLDPINNPMVAIDQVYVVWFSKTLQNWKVMASSNIADGMYYEITHNGDKNETYLDAYKKLENVTILENGGTIVRPNHKGDK